MFCASPVTGPSRCRALIVRYNGAMDGTGEEHAGLVARLILALGAQIDAGTAPGLASQARDALAGLSRFEIREFFGHAGHLVHYDEPPGVERLSELVAESIRDANAARDGLQPGDRVRLDGPLPPDLRGASEDWLRATAFTVRFVADDRTVDIQPDFREDYVILTVPASAVTATA